MKVERFISNATIVILRLKIFGYRFCKVSVKFYVPPRRDFIGQVHKEVKGRVAI